MDFRKTDRDNMNSCPSAVLVLFHCESNTGYAIGRLEPILFQVAMNLCGQDSRKVHFAYPSMTSGKPAALPQDFNQYVVFNSATTDKAACRQIQRYISEHQIDTLIGFDQPVHLPCYRYLRAGGIRKLVSYWGAPMSSLFGPFKLALKKLDVLRRRYGPDLYIFESHGMQETAVKGRGIPARKTRVVYLGVDTDMFRPDAEDKDYPYRQFEIPLNRRIFFYSGHMEHRKGVWVIMQAANWLAAHRESDDWHILLTGNQPGEETELFEQLTPSARERVTFGGYRDDIPRIHRGCYAGIIASTGWDSLTCSSLEMQASGLPLICSDLPGLREAAHPRLPSLRFTPGSSDQLAKVMVDLIENPSLRENASQLAMNRVREQFSTSIQVERLTQTVAEA